MFIDDGRDIDVWILDLMELVGFPFQPFWIQTSQNVLLMFHIFLQLFLKAGFVLVHVRLFETYIERIRQHLARPCLVFLLLFHRRLGPLKSQSLYVIQVWLQRVFSWIQQGHCIEVLHCTKLRKVQAFVHSLMINIFW